MDTIKAPNTLKYYSDDISDKEIAEGLEDEHPLVVLAARKAQAKRKGIGFVHGLNITHSVVSVGGKHLDQIFLHAPVGFSEDPVVQKVMANYNQKFHHFNPHFDGTVLGYVTYGDGMVHFASFPFLDTNTVDPVYEFMGITQPYLNNEFTGILRTGVSDYLGIKPEDLTGYIENILSGYLGTFISIPSSNDHLTNYLIATVPLKGEQWDTMNKLSLYSDVGSNMELFQTMFKYLFDESYQKEITDKAVNGTNGWDTYLRTAWIMLQSRLASISKEEIEYYEQNNGACNFYNPEVTVSPMKEE